MEGRTGMLARDFKFATGATKQQRDSRA
jgi:hypothetical protein